MPRATRSTVKASLAPNDVKPYTKNTSTKKSAQSSNSDCGQESSKPPRKGRDGKDSHLYTDDNPSTTLHGTGFKDAATAEHTIELVSRRSLLYQFQTINTMYHRAAHHPAGAKNANIQAAMKTFRQWLDEVYPKHRAEQRNYPLLRKDVVERYLPQLEQQATALGVELEWTVLYAKLPKGKRLANVLMDETKPDERDLAVVRQTFLDKTVDTELGGEVSVTDNEGLWKDGTVSPLHLKLIAYGFSPVKPDELLRKCG